MPEATIQFNSNDYRVVFEDNSTQNKKQKKQKTYEQLLQESIPANWRLIKAGETIKYPIKRLLSTYDPTMGWEDINVLGNTRLGFKYRAGWEYYLIPDKK